MNKNKLSNIKIVLVHTTHPGNIGAAARAMKNMGLENLCLVKPTSFPHSEATARAVGADDILEKAEITESVLEAIENCQLVIGTSARLRTIALPLLNPKTCAKLLFSEKVPLISKKIAILFGTESAGLPNEELLRCHYHLHIPTVHDFHSLNLAAAVQIMTYELRMAFLECEEGAKTQHLKKTPGDELANRGDVERFYAHLEQILTYLNFLKPLQAHQVMQRLKRLFNRAQLEVRELNILRGILTVISKK